ncbi:ATP-dependent Clp protease ATP-binding subunit [Candidatus Nomurabacteria bacterium]|uniref:ATP-dependent Clp protease ATP-binding subunit n=1 Tax=Candidatus Dojkabacteria bacterium TaxID=2099670 RepID=A0A955I1L5_9BACT|nr:ATP-dependent Clp protease ATP-binding subunit [Candidatus Dojkabacteria bacterium]MCB9789942.1 ATP-dependent Clp protease ATP-binding subunit [Candidatus Nomurabacteria bacterium]MCB9803432.1 ATP-dependent Clp protease ATP-binding subunit [Candidatus Nomurabacteria bacterium]
MVCQNCGLRPATTQITTSRNGQEQTIQLCSACASQLQRGGMYEGFFGDGSSPDRSTGEQVDITQFFSERAKDAIQLAANEAIENGNRNIDTEHLLLAIIQSDEVVGRILKELKVDKGMLMDQLRSQFSMGEGSTTPGLSPRAKQALQYAFSEAMELGHNYVGGEHIFLGLLKEGEGLAAQILTKSGIEHVTARQAVLKIVGEGDVEGKKAAEKSETPTLDKFSRDLTQLARIGKIDPVIGRSDEITRVIQILSRRKKNNPVLIGEPGVGKTAIAEGLAYRISKGNVPEILKDRTIKELDVASLVAGSKFRGEFEERAKKIIEELNASARSIILFIDELHTIVGSGAQEGQMDLSNMLKPALARGELQVIGATTLNEYKKYIEKDAALERRFQPVLVNEPSIEQTIEILRGLRDKYEAHHKVKIEPEALDSAANLSSRYIKDRFLPDKAIDLVDEAASKVRLTTSTEPEELRELKDEIEKMEKERESLSRANKHEESAKVKMQIEQVRSDKLQPLLEEWNKVKGTGTPNVTSDDIITVVAAMTGIPLNQLQEEERDRLINLEDVLHKRVVGQEDAVKAVSEAVRRARVGLKDPNKPIATFLFLGPTGVGKTLLAKTLAEQIFGDEDAIVRIDMSEYMEKHAVSRMIGSPPGYVGYEEGGQLTEAVRRKPFSVILLDEIEKAHPDIFNTLLQLFDEGRLTDSKGRTVDFKNTIIIATSNLGSEKIMAYMELQTKEKSWESLKEQLMEDLKKAFKPEFLNRLDDIILFKSLERTQLINIVKILLEETKQLMNAQDVDIEFDDTIVDHIIELGYEPEFGARPLKRVIQKEIENTLANKLLNGDLSPGEKYILKYRDTKIVITQKKSQKK